MSIEKKVNKIVASTIKDLLNGKYKLVEIGDHTSILQYGSNELEVWVANGSSHCKIYSTVNGLEFPEFEEDVRKQVFKLASTKTPYMTLVKLKKARKAHKESYLKYKESVELVKTLKAEYKEANVDQLDF